MNRPMSKDPQQSNDLIGTMESPLYRRVVLQDLLDKSRKTQAIINDKEFKGIDDVPDKRKDVPTLRSDLAEPWNGTYVWGLLKIAYPNEVMALLNGSLLVIQLSPVSRMIVQFRSNPSDSGTSLMYEYHISIWCHRQCFRRARLYKVEEKTGAELNSLDGFREVWHTEDGFNDTKLRGLTDSVLEIVDVISNLIDLDYDPARTVAACAETKMFFQNGASFSIVED